MKEINKKKSDESRKHFKVNTYFRVGDSIWSIKE